MDDNVFQQNAKLLKSKMLNDSCALKWTSSETTAHNIMKCGWYCSEKIKIFYCGALLTQNIIFINISAFIWTGYFM